MDIRCVVTGQNESGKSVVIRSTPVPPINLSLLRATNSIVYGEAILSPIFLRTEHLRPSPATSRRSTASALASSPFRRKQKQTSPTSQRPPLSRKSKKSSPA
jgi:hypothetical protein